MIALPRRRFLLSAAASLLAAPAIAQMSKPERQEILEKLFQKVAEKIR